MKPLIISVGDPAGIGPEVVFRALDEYRNEDITVVCDWKLTRQHLDAVGLEPGIDAVISGSEQLHGGHVVLDTDSSQEEVLTPGSPSTASARAAIGAVDQAASLMNDGAGRALVTAPISKRDVARLRPSTDWPDGAFRGHTEYLAHGAGLHTYGRDYAMMFDSPGLTVVLASVHVPLREAITRVRAQHLFDLVLLTTRSLDRLGRPDSRIAVAGLNPHAGEGGMFGEEESVVKEAVDRAASEGIAVTGPWPPDTVFHAAVSGDHDAVIALYHDQGLIPVKTLYFTESVNVTIGLPWLRASVDHGTAFDIAGRGVADHRPMSWAIGWASRHSDPKRGIQ